MAGAIPSGKTEARGVSEEEVKKLLECPACSEMIHPPIVLCSRGHSICNDCMDNLKTCPSCRGPFTQVPNQTAEKLHELFEKCVVKCKYQESGCPIEMTRREVAEHEQVCKYRPILCRECDELIPYKKFLDHLKDEKLKANGAACHGLSLWNPLNWGKIMIIQSIELLSKSLVMYDEILEKL